MDLNWKIDSLLLSYNFAKEVQNIMQFKVVKLYSIMWTNVYSVLKNVCPVIPVILVSPVTVLWCQPCSCH